MLKSKPFYKNIIFTAAALAIVVSMVNGCSETKNTKEVSADNTEISQEKNNEDNSDAAIEETKAAIENADDNTSSLPSANDSPVNYDNFVKIDLGMSYDEVKEILGEGKLDTESKRGDITTQLYSWRGKGLSNVSVIFQNNAVTNKSQFKLQDMDAGLTLEKYDQVQKGMSYEEVKNLIGEGQVSSQGKAINKETIMYEYLNKDGSSANFVFDSKGLTLKSQFNLK